MDWASLGYYAVFATLLLVGLCINVLGLPGLWLMVVSALGYAWITGWRHLGWPGLVTLTALAAIAELLEFLAGSAGARKFGGSKRGMIGAVVGGLLGALFLSIPVPVIGTIIGAVAGTFVGAWAVELMMGKQMNQSVQIGIGAAKGRLWGTLLKLAVGTAMLLVGLIVAFPVGAPSPVSGATPTRSTTTQSNRSNPDTLPAVEH